MARNKEGKIGPREAGHMGGKRIKKAEREQDST